MNWIPFLSQEAPAAPTGRQDWEMWPFVVEGWWEAAAKAALLIGILLAIGVFLRLLYGPGGPLRPKDLDEDAARQHQAALDELETRLRQGDIDQEEYEHRKRML